MKFSVRPQFVRLQGLIGLIRDGTQSGRLPNGALFIERFRVSRFTILRDLDFLRDEWGAPIEYDASKKGYFLADPAWTVPAVKLDRREVFALGIARKVMAAFRGTPLEAEMQSAMARVAETLEGHISLEPAAMTEHLSVLTEDYAPQNPEIWLAAARYAHHRERVRMRYRRFDGVIRDYEVEPMHLAAFHGDWYLLANHPKRGKIVSFALSRIRRIHGTGELFPEPDRQTIRKLLDERFGIVGGDEVLDVRLLFSPSVAAYIAGRIWHPSQTLHERRDGSVELRMKTSGWKELVRFILSWQPDVKVLHPARLRERIREKMTEGLAAQEGERPRAVRGSAPCPT